MSLRESTIKAQLDFYPICRKFVYALENGSAMEIKAGVRYSKREHKYKVLDYIVLSIGVFRSYLP